MNKLETILEIYCTAKHWGVKHCSIVKRMEVPSILIVRYNTDFQTRKNLLDEIQQLKSLLPEGVFVETNDITCLAVWDPVCGSDGDTYFNKCTLHAFKCRNDRHDLTVLHKGECDKPTDGEYCLIQTKTIVIRNQAWYYDDFQNTL